MRWLALLVGLQGVAFAQLNPRVATPPLAEQRPHEVVIHGETLSDPFSWLKVKSDPKTIQYLKAENDYTKKVMGPTAAFQTALYKEMLGRIKEDDAELPTYDDGYWYYSKTVKGKSYPIQVRRKGSLRAKEEVLLDLNDIAKGKPFISAGASDVSPNGRMMAYTIDTTGFREYQLFVKDLKTRTVRSERLGKALQVEWGGDSQTLYFVTEDAAKRWNKLWRYRLGGKPQLIFEEKDRLYWFSIAASRDQKYLFLNSNSAETSEVRALDLTNPDGKPRLIMARAGKHRYFVDHREGRFFIRTNDNGRNYRLVTTPVDATAKSNWKEVVPHRATVMLEGVDLFKGHMFLNERTGGFQRVRYCDLKTGVWKEIPTPEKARTINMGDNRDPSATKFRYAYGSLKTPNSIYEFDPKRGNSKLLKQQPVLGGYKASNYESKVLWATARDGVKVPISLVYRAGLKPSKATPLLLEGYGSYGAPSDPDFSSTRVSLLNRGVVFAVPHIRGGGEFGTPWHDNGKMAKKMNTFTDFIDCADFLVKSGWTSHERLAIRGGSAGGLLMGAVLNLRPDLALQAIADVPFVDVINTMLDDTLPLTTGEYLEWGNPNNPDEYKWIRAYSPYENVTAQAYPHILVNTSLNDSQVLYHEPAKWVAKLRITKTDDNVLLLKTNMDAGHGGASGRYDALKETAFDFAFLLWNWGIRK